MRLKKRKNEKKIRDSLGKTDLGHDLPTHFRLLDQTKISKNKKTCNTKCAVDMSVWSSFHRKNQERIKSGGHS